MLDCRLMIVDPFTKLLDRVAGLDGSYRAADNSDDRVAERLNDPAQPVAVHHAICVRERHDIGGRVNQSAVPRGGRPPFRFVKNGGAVAVAIENRRRAIARRVVDQKQLNVIPWKGHGEDRLDAISDCTLAIVYRNDHGDSRHLQAEAAMLPDARHPMRSKNRT